MSDIIYKILPIILISVIFYILVYKIYPRYQELIDLTKRFNELKNKEDQINELEKLIKALSQNSNIQVLIKNKEILEIWVPTKPNIDNLLASLLGIFQMNNLIFKGTDFQFIEEPKIYNANVLPVRVINFELAVDINNDNLMNFINAIEQNSRLMTIKKAKISSSEESIFVVESYYFSEK